MRLGTLGIATVACLFATASLAQQPAAPQGGGRGGGGRGQQLPQVASPEVSADRKITFRLAAPQAQSVRLNASDIPAPLLGPAATLTKAENGVWSTTIGPIDSGAYRYNFNVDGVSTIDPRSPAISESNANVWSLVYVPGSDFMDTKNVPHGSVAAVPYFSTALNAWRRLHVYTPPGYETNGDKYPVFYLLHGAGDNDDSWTSVGRANYILDNLIAAKKAKPMVIVMTAGHTPPAPATQNAGQRGGGGFLADADPFAREFVTDVMPLVEKRYRVMTDRAHTAMAGLSMGGAQTLNIAIPNLQRFAYIGVYSSGLIGEAGGGGNRGAAPTANPAPSVPAPSSWETRNLATLDSASLKKGTKLVWLSTGKDDSLMSTTKATVDVLRKHGFNVMFEESPGGHTWINWRNYLNTFAPQLFQ